jgi:hypothetical protein
VYRIIVDGGGRDFVLVGLEHEGEVLLTLPLLSLLPPVHLIPHLRQPPHHQAQNEG